MLIDVQGLKAKRKEYQHGIKQIDKLLKFSRGLDLDLNGAGATSTVRHKPVARLQKRRKMSAVAKAKISRAMKARHREKKQAAMKK